MKEETLEQKVKRLEQENAYLQKRNQRLANEAERKAFERSWRDNPDCSGGAYRQDEIDAANK